MDLNIVLAAASLLLFVALLAYFGYVAYHQQQIEPDEKPATGVELLRQHYGPGDTVEQPTPYWVAPIPSAPDTPGYPLPGRCTPRRRGRGRAW